MGELTRMIESKLAEKGLSLPDAPKPAANYEPFVIEGGLLYVSGQIAAGPDGLITGRLGDGMTTEAGAKAAQACALSILAQAKSALGGDFDRVARLVKLTGFVATTPDFTEQPKVINGASDLMVELMGEKGRHARSAVGVAALPLGVAVEIEAVFALA
ncbi:RidA family protein [Limimaricola pyoseonensis]|uniref:Enamine deaminase RidA, house cleaning of reactive enamine intermediates, YjgF/YER057c/UK114 family n=1 Tax=Limimaricola pyoseonensis TaxID=521013 RepID=A0A1G7F3J9_9RHOB|nr:RidA family protein [Limimaricola pyoseonensis]SDE70412.1 Enamine deaminase RidA, house cleaning of reactive enamine intermediates, YjgF/YER057c/UK114 family [Limimaricola pyoseonensis]